MATDKTAHARQVIAKADRDAAKGGGNGRPLTDAEKAAITAGADAERRRLGR
jgi:hypothetical protein